MPQYFFHVYEGGRRIEDREGTSCDDLLAAKAYAIESARDLAGQAIGNGTPPSSLCVEVTDMAGHTLAALTISEVMEHPVAPAFKESC